MKKVLVLSAVLLCVATISQASILNVQLTTDWNPTIGGNGVAPDPANWSDPLWNAMFTITVSFKITADPAISLTENLVNKGLCDYAVTLYTPGTVGNIIALDEMGHFCFTDVGTGKPNVTWRESLTTTVWSPGQHKYITTSVPPYWGETLSTRIPGQIADVDGDGDMDWIQICNGATGVSGDFNLANNGDYEWVFQTTMYMNHYQTTTLAATVASSSRHWDADNLDGGKTPFSNFTSNQLVLGPPPGTAPIISLTGPTGKVNTTPGTNTAPVAFVMTLTAGDPVPATTSITYGDGNGEPGSNITTVGGTATFNHIYTLGAGVNQAGWTANGTAANGISPDGTASDTVTIVQSPMAAAQVSIDGGSFFTPGSTVFVEGNSNVNLSMANSTGYIESYLITKGGSTLSTSGTWNGNSYLLYGTVHFQVSNTGSGANTDGFDVTFVPEPATLALLGVGAMVSLLRRRK